MRTSSKLLILFALLLLVPTWAAAVPLSLSPDPALASGHELEVAWNPFEGTARTFAGAVELEGSSFVDVRFDAATSELTFTEIELIAEAALPELDGDQTMRALLAALFFDDEVTVVVNGADGAFAVEISVEGGFLRDDADAYAYLTGIGTLALQGSFSYDEGTGRALLDVDGALTLNMLILAGYPYPVLPFGLATSGGPVELHFEREAAGFVVFRDGFDSGDTCRWSIGLDPCR